MEGFILNKEYGGGCYFLSRLFIKHTTTQIPAVIPAVLRIKIAYNIRSIKLGG